MKSKNLFKNAFTSLLLAVALVTVDSRAQMAPGAGMPGMDPVMTKLFGNNKAFTALAEFNVKETGAGDPVSMGMNFAMLDGKTRMDMDLASFKGGAMPPTMVAELKKRGMDKMVSITRPDKKAMLVIYPALKVYAEQVMDAAELKEMNKDYKIEKSSVGKETVDGHACEKNKIVATNDKGEKHEILVWNASDLKDFPVQMQMAEKGSTVLVKFKNVKLDKPAADQFEAPAGYTKYGDVQQMMVSEMMKSASGAAGASPK